MNHRERRAFNRGAAIAFALTAMAEWCREADRRRRVREERAELDRQYEAAMEKVAGRLG